MQLSRGKGARKYEKNLYDRLIPIMLSKSKNHFFDLAKDIIEKAFAKFTE